MGADQYVDLPGFHFLQDFLLLFGRAEAADHLDGDGKCRKALLERLVVLKRENGCRGKNRDLLVVAQGLERRAHGNFGFAVTNVAAQQPVHRAAGLHVGLDVHDRLSLIFGLSELEGILEFFHPLGVSGKRVSLRHLPLRIQLQEFVGHVLHGLAHASFGLRPRCCAQMAEHGLGAFG
jgi:hypothetical protein